MDNVIGGLSPDYTQTELIKMNYLVRDMNIKFDSLSDRWNDINSAKYNAAIIQGVNAAWAAFQSAASSYAASNRAAREELKEMIEMTESAKHDIS